MIRFWREYICVCYVTCSRACVSYLLASTLVSAQERAPVARALSRVRARLKATHDFNFVFELIRVSVYRLLNDSGPHITSVVRRCERIALSER